MKTLTIDEIDGSAVVAERYDKVTFFNWARTQDGREWILDHDIEDWVPYMPPPNYDLFLDIVIE